MSFNSKAFSILNNIITSEDIIPIVHTAHDEVSHEVNDDRVVVSTPEADETGTVTSSNEDTDLLFSPLGDIRSDQTEDDEDEDEYDHGLLSPIYFHTQYPKRFHHNQTVTNNVASVNNLSSTANNISNAETNTNSDFWNEVTATEEEAITFANNEDELFSIINTNTEKDDKNEVGEKPESSLLANLVTDELESNSNNTSNNKSSPAESPLWESADAKIKLFCYRNKTGSLELKTHIDAGNSSMIGNTNKKIKKSKKNKRKFVRRKSGISQMISTNIGIGEFML